MQVIETLENATAAGGISKTDIADITPTLIKVLEQHDFRNDWNPKIFVRYRDNEPIFIQAFGHETLIDLAKKRNQAFFTVLLGE